MYVRLKVKWFPVFNHDEPSALASTRFATLNIIIFARRPGLDINALPQTNSFSWRRTYSRMLVIVYIALRISTETPYESFELLDPIE